MEDSAPTLQTINNLIAKSKETGSVADHMANLTERPRFARMTKHIRQSDDLRNRDLYISN